MKKEKSSIIRISYPETSTKVLVCSSGEVCSQMYAVSKRKGLISLSVKDGPHRISTRFALEVTVLNGKTTVLVKGRKPVVYDGEGTFSVPASGWMEITAAPFAQFIIKQDIPAALSDDDDDCMLR
jgi:hypothetical protein